MNVVSLASLSEILMHTSDPRGRCNRKGLLIVAGLLLGAEALIALALWVFDADMEGGAVVALKTLFCWFAICAGSKRLHDLNRTAWWMLAALAVTTVWTLVLTVAMVVTLGPEALAPTSGWYVVALVGASMPIFAATLWMHFAKGVPGANRYGTEPKDLGFSGPEWNLRPGMAYMQRWMMPATA